MSLGNPDENAKEEERPKPEPRKRATEPSSMLTPDMILGWATARAGLGMNFVGGILLVIGLVLKVMLFLGLRSRDPGESGNLLVLVSDISNFLITLGTIIYLLGMFLSGGSSMKSRAKGWSLAARVMIFVIPLTIFLFIITSSIEDRQERDLDQVLLAVVVFQLGGLMLCWMMYLRHVATYVGSHSTATSGLVLLIVSEVLLLLQLILAFSNIRLIDGKGYHLISALVGIGLVGWQISILYGVRSGLTQFLIHTMLRRGR